jgi:hypothetical protein
MDHDEAIAGLFAERYFLDELTDEERRIYEDHLLTCMDCAQQVRDLSCLIDESKEIFASETLENLGVVFFSPGHPGFERELEQAVGQTCLSPFVDAIKGISVVLKNASPKTVIGYSVNWKYDTDTSSTVRGVSHADLEPLFDGRCEEPVRAVPGGRSISISPGSARLVSLVGNLDVTESQPPPGWRYESVHEIEALMHNAIISVFLDGVMFHDGTFIGADRNGLFERAIASFDGLQDLYHRIHEMSGKLSRSDLLAWVKRQSACDEQITFAGPHDDRVRFERAVAAKEFLRINGEQGLSEALEWSRARFSRRRPDFRRLSSTKVDFDIRLPELGQPSE